MKVLLVATFHLLCVFGHGYEFVHALSSLTGMSFQDAVSLCGMLMIVTIIIGPSVYESLMRFTAMDLPDVDLVDDETEEEDVENETVRDATGIYDDPEFARLMLKNRTECTVA